MADIIQLLPDNIANQIAAGEVVQRPSSVVKELMENSIDAGAKNIKLIVKDAGKTLIQVVDDGIGMTTSDAKKCFERHATSKIRKTEDLFSIKTMGFRGEAMASIAAVAQVEMRTRQRNADLGLMLTVENSKIIQEEPCQAAIGTSISVKNLFFNIPARRAFLKTNNVEMKHIVDEFQHLALANPDIFFSLYHNGNKLYHLPKANLRQRVVAVLGSKSNHKLIPIEEETDILRIYGYIGKPEGAKKTRGEQFFFVNKRYIKSSYLHHAIVNAYENLLAPKTHPLYIVFFELNPGKVDVNVHPTKQEVKFEDERLVYNYLRVTARHALAQNSITPSLDFELEKGISQHLNPALYKDTEAIVRKEESKKTSSYSPPKRSEREESNLRNWEDLYKGLDMDEEGEEETDLVEEESYEEGESEGTTLASLWGENQLKELRGEEESERITSKMSTSSTLLGEQENQNNHLQSQLHQLHNKYILSQIKSGFMLIDQNKAHQRILYEQYLSAFEQRKVSVQKLIFPQTIHLAAQDSELLKGMIEELNQLGIDIKEFGGNSFIVHGLPAELNGVNEQALIDGIVEGFYQNLKLKIDVYDNLARSLARQAAIREGKVLTPPEMQQLIDELFACETPYLAPNGQKTFITLNLEDLAKRFN